MGLDPAALRTAPKGKGICARVALCEGLTCGCLCMVGITEDDQPAHPTHPWEKSPKACLLPNLGSSGTGQGCPYPGDH